MFNQYTIMLLAVFVVGLTQSSETHVPQNDGNPTFEDISQQLNELTKNQNKNVAEAPHSVENISSVIDHRLASVKGDLFLVRADLHKIQRDIDPALMAYSSAVGAFAGTTTALMAIGTVYLVAKYSLRLATYCYHKIRDHNKNDQPVTIRPDSNQNQTVIILKK
jgi:hypothetical protein